LEFGGEMRIPSDLLFGVPPDKERPTTDYKADFVGHLLHEIHNYAQQNLQVGRNRVKTQYDKLANSAAYQEGESVWLYRPTRKTNKLRGP
jgi:hypothetical protein